MRKEPDSESEDDARYGPYGQGPGRRKHLVRKHPNKHREGDRKRWREIITERERKRYEGVWAANRGLLISASTSRRPIYTSGTSPPPDEPTQDVSNIVCRDLWVRSRLPDHVLEEVWDLVDNRQIGRLTREEFVVGLWLIDQVLKGRKLPVKVQESVWNSVRGMGVKLRRYKIAPPDNR